LISLRYQYRSNTFDVTFLNVRNAAATWLRFYVNSVYLTQIRFVNFRKTIKVNLHRDMVIFQKLTGSICLHYTVMLEMKRLKMVCKIKQMNCYEF